MPQNSVKKDVKTVKMHLKSILESEDIADDIISYIYGIENEDDFDEFMESIVDRSNKVHVQAYEILKKMLFRTSQSSPKSNALNVASNSKNIRSVSSKKGKPKFRDIYTYEEKVKIQEKSFCDCFGQEHELVDNCLTCGRIQCEKEGSGLCLFCGNPISAEETALLALNNQKGDLNMNPKRNKVFDDDSDYFKFKSKKRNEDKQKMVIALDLASRKVIHTTEEDVRIKKMLLEDSMQHLKKVEQLYKDIQESSEKTIKQNMKQSVNEELINLLIQMRHRKPKNEEEFGEEDSFASIVNYNTKVFSEDLIMNVDHGMCLSMHQPYASLLVAGVKKHEGRTWFTNHRGRLWIAATSKEPERDEIESIEIFYKEYYEDNTLQFPQEYPTRSLLGCVFVEDCLEQSEYRQRYPNGESNSPYVLICSNPIILPIFYPISGKHKIYSLDKDLHNCAKLALQHAKYL